MEKVRVEEALRLAEETINNLINNINDKAGPMGRKSSMDPSSDNYILAIATLASGILTAK